MPDKKKLLQEYVATANNPKYNSDFKVINSKFPELKGYDEKLLQEYVATANNEKYNSDFDVINSKFPELFGEKKKDQTEVSPSTAANPKSVSEPKVGSLGTKGGKMKEYTGLSNEQMTQMKVPAEQRPQQQAAKKSAAQFTKIQDKAVARQNQKAVATAYKQSTYITPDEMEIAKQEVNDEVNTVGFTNTVKSGFKKGWNMMANAATALASLGTETNALESVKFDTDPLKEEKKEAEKILMKEIKSREAITPQLIEEKAKEIKVEKKVESLKATKINDFMQNLDYGQKSALQIDKIEGYTSVSEQNKMLLKEMQLKKNTAEDVAEDFTEISAEIGALIKQGQQVSPELTERHKQLESELKTHVSELQKLNSKYTTNTEDLGTAEEELDIVKREYGWSDNFFGNIGASIGELALNSLAGLDYVGSFGGNFDPHNTSESVIKDIVKKKEIVSQTREKLMRPIDEINSVNDFVDYTSNLVANQLPSLAVTSTGIGGLITIGVSGAGEKYSEMVTENSKGKPRFSKLQTAISPLVFGGAEVISEIPTLSILKNGKRVLQSINATDAGKEMVKESFRKQVGGWALDFGKDVSRETAGELVTNTLQNLNSIIVEGNKNISIFDNSGRVLKDAVLLTSLLKVAPHMVVLAAKPLQSKKSTAELESNAKTILTLSEKLNTEGITPEVKAVVQENIDRLTKANNTIIKKTISDTEKMPVEVFDKVVELDKEASIIRSKAEAIKNDMSIDIKTRMMLLKNSENDYKEVERQREKMVSGEASAIDALPEKEATKLKDKAARELVKEAEADGKKSATFNDSEITEKANKIYEQSKQETTATEKVETAQPEAKIEETKQEVLADESTPETDNATDADVRPGVDAVGEVGETTVPTGETLGEESISATVDLRTPKTEVRKVENNDYSKFSDSELESKLSELESTDMKEFLNVEKELEKRERDSIFNVPLQEAGKKLDELKQRHKNYKTEGEPFIDKRDVSESKEVVSRYSNPSELSNKEVMDDFSNSLRGNPTTWYADGLKLRESANEAAKRGITFEKLLQKTKEIYLKEGYDEKTSQDVVKMFLEPIFKNAEITSTNENVQKVKSLKDATYDVHFDESGSVTKIISPKDGREIPKFREVKKKVKDPVTGITEEKTVLQKNANYSRIEADATGGLTNNKANEEVKAERKQKLDKALNDFTPASEYEHALNYMARGGKLNGESAKKETGLSGKEVKWVSGFNANEDLPSVEAAAENIVMEAAKNGVHDLDEQAVRNALIEIASTKKGVNAVQDELIGITDEGSKAKADEELRTYLGSLSEQDLAKVEAMMAEDSYLEDLTNDEKLEYYESQYGQQQNAEPENGLDQLRETERKSEDSTPSVQEREGKTEVKSEKISESELPDVNKKGDSKTVKLSDTVEARVSVVEFMDGENGYSVQLFNNGELVEDKHGDTETEFASEDSADLIKFLDSKKKGYALSKNGKGKTAAVKDNMPTAERRVSFNLFGVEAFGTQKTDGSIVGDDNMKYSKGMIDSGMITDVSEINEDVNYRSEADAAQQGFFGGGKRKDSSLSKSGGAMERNYYTRKVKRFWNRLIKSNAGLDFKSGETVRSLQRDIDYLQDTMGTDNGIFKSVLRGVQKAAKNKEDLRLKLLALDKFMQGSGGKLSFLSNDEMDKLDYLRGRIDSLSEQLENKLQDQLDTMIENGASEERITALTELIEKVRNNKGKYINRSYQIYHDEKYREGMAMAYDKMPQEYKRRYDNAVNLLMREDGMSKEDAESYISGYLDDIIRSKGELSQGFAGRADAPFLKKRKELPIEFQELLGVVRDPVENYLRTVDKISRYIATIAYQEKMRTHLLDSGIGVTKPKQGYTKLTSDAKEWETLGDIYVPAEFKEALEDMMPLEKVNQWWVKTWIQFASMTKVGKTVLNPSGVFRNFMSGTFLGLNAGHFTWTNPQAMSVAFSQAFKTSAAKGSLASLRKELIEQEIVGSGADSQEMLTFMNDFSNSIDRKLSKNPIVPIMNFMQKAYAFGDDFYKVSGYIVEKKRLMDTGLSESEATRMAGERIRGGYPTYSYLPRVFKELRRLPLVGTFISFPYEVVRSTKNNALFVHEDLKGGRSKMAMQRAAGMVVANAIPTFAATYVAGLIGIDDEDDDKLRELLPDYQKDALLLYYDKDEKGYPKFVDLTAFAPAEVIVKPLRIVFEEREGRDATEKVQKSITEVLKPYLGADLSTKTANELLTNNDEFNRKIYKAENFYEALMNQKDLTQVINYYMKKAGPGVYSNISDFLRANDKGSDVLGDKFTAYGKEYTNTDAALGFFGIRTSSINYSQAILNSSKRVTAELNDNKEFLRKFMKSTTKMDDDKIKLNLDSYVKGEDEAYRTILRSVEIGFKFNIDKNAMAALFETANYSLKDKAFLVNGFQPPYDYITLETAKNKLEEIRSNYPKEKAEAVVQTYKNNILKFNEMIDVKNKELYDANGQTYQTLYRKYGQKNPLK